MRRTHLVVTIAISLFFSSCGGNINCRNEPISLVFNNFDSLALSKVVLRKFTKGSDFTQQLDSIFSGSASSPLTTDTVGTRLNNLTYAVINADYDWTVYVSGTQRTYKIKGITYHQKREHTSCKLCENDCKNDCSYTINDSLHNYIGSTYNRLYFHIYR